MNFDPNPTELQTERPSRAEHCEHRNVFCPLYDGCLNLAIRRAWADWTCAHCALVDKTPVPSAAVFSRDRPQD